jgi:hypothetical protein
MGKTASFSKSQLARAYEKLLNWQKQLNSEQAQLADTAAKQEIEGQHAKTTLGNIGSPCTS